MMRKSVVSIIIMIIIILNIVIIYTPQNKVKGTAVSGLVSGVWTPSGNPYIVTDYINVSSSATLDLRPGVVVKFKLDAEFTIENGGVLFANGTAAQPITFTSDLASPYIGCWEGLDFQVLGTGMLSNCSISYAINGINASATHKLKVKDCDISKCVNGTRFDTVTFSIIENCKIHDNLHNGIYSFWGMGYNRFMNNSIYRNGKGINLEINFFCEVNNNTLHNNTMGVRLRYCSYTQLVNNTIEDTNFPIPMPDTWNKNYFGILLNRSNYNFVYGNKIVDTTDHAMMISFSKNNTVDKNYIKNATGSGMYLLRATSNLFYNNTIVKTNKSAIRLVYTSNDNEFSNTAIIKFNDRIGVYFELDSIWNHFLKNNRVNNIPLRVYYQTPGNKISSELSGTSIIEPKMTNLGQVMIVNCENFTIHSLSMANGESGLFFFDSDNGSMVNLSIQNMNDYAVYCGYDSTNIAFANASISLPFSALGYFYLDKYSNVSVLNTTFDQSKVIYQDFSAMQIQWYLNVRVQKAISKQAIAGANVKVFDVFGKLVYNGFTSNQGTARFIVCTQKIRQDKNSTSFNRHNVSAFKIHHQPGYAKPQVLVDGTKWVTIELYDNHDPSLGGSVTPAITHNRTPILSWFKGIDPDNDKLQYWVNIWSLKQPGKILETGNSFSTNYVVKNNLSYGERYGVNVTASDTYGGWSNDIKGSFDVVNHAPSEPEIIITPLENQNHPTKNEDLNCSIIKPSTDIDRNPKDQIKYHFLWFKNNEFQEKLSIWNSTELYHVLDKNYTSFGDEWTCKVTATDGFELSQTVSASCIIKNSNPKVIKTIPFVEMDEDTVDFTSINLLEVFVDPDAEPLNFSYSSSGDNISIDINQQNGSVIITPKPNWWGVEIVKFSAFDIHKATAAITTKITVLSINDPPVIEIVFPTTGSYFYHNYSFINLIGKYNDPDIEFGDKISLTWTSNISGILGHEAQLENVDLPIGSHLIEFMASDLMGITAKDEVVINVVFFDINNNTNFTIPQVKLLEPLNNQIINTTSTTLYWTVLNLNESEKERVLFDIYLDTTDVPSNIISEKHLGNSITIQNLNDNTTYYWTVIPYLDKFPGICIDKTWSFQIDFIFKKIDGVELSMTEDELEVEAGKIKIYNFSIKNTGNVIDKFRISISYLDNNELIEYTSIEQIDITLKAMEELTVNLTFDIPKNVGKSDIKDNLIITVNSIIGPAENSISRNITIKIKPIEPEDKKVDELPNDLMTIIYWMLLILILILLTLIILASSLMVGMNKQTKLPNTFKSKRIVEKIKNNTKESK